MEKLLFREEQRFTQWWIWLLLIAATLISVVPVVIGLYTQEVLGEPWGNNPAETPVLVAILCFVILLMGTLILLFFKMRLIVEIRKNGIWFRFPPLSRKWLNINIDEIEKYEIRTYRPATEYGGWGIKGNKRNKAYNVSGNIGLQIYLKNGNKILFGTQKKQAIIYAMEVLMKREREV